MTIITKFAIITTGSFRKNDKSKMFVRILIFTKISCFRSETSGKFMPYSIQVHYKYPKKLASLMCFQARKGCLMKRFIDNLSSLKKNINEDQIRITVSVATISLANRAALDEIRKLEAATIDWSNLPDYLTTQVPPDELVQQGFWNELG